MECLVNGLLDRYAGLRPGANPPVPQTATLLQHSCTVLPLILEPKPMALEHANIAMVKDVFARFGAGDVPAILELLDEAVVIDFYGPATIPYAGHHETRNDARRFFETVLASVEIHQFDPEEFIASGDKVVVTGHLRLTARKTGGSIESDFVHVITVRDGKWLHFRDFMNTVEADRAFRG